MLGLYGSKFAHLSREGSGQTTNLLAANAIKVPKYHKLAGITFIHTVKPVLSNHLKEDQNWFSRQMVA